MLLSQSGKTEYPPYKDFGDVETIFEMRRPCEYETGKVWFFKIKTKK